MKICVCSDSHGNSKGLQEMMDRERPEALFFLGDGERDWKWIAIPQEILFLAVCGNCDFASMWPASERIELCGKQIFLTHGHLYGAKQGLYGLERYVSEHPADLVLYGHTHHPDWQNHDLCDYICPGSMGCGEERYAVITLKKHASMEVSFRRL
ncbi:MAG: YfcE family phosphodiesterase [Clostridia bacterium]|nr:YfcE family phosphodiesterase [Clostridia bacterium]